MTDLPSETALLLGRMEGKLDALITQTSAMNNRIDGHETRISSLEKWRAYLLGAAAVVGAGFAKIIDFLTR